MDNLLYEKVLKDINTGQIYSELGKDIHFDIYVYSCLIKLKPEKKYVKELCLLVLQTEE